MNDDTQAAVQTLIKQMFPEIKDIFPIHLREVLLNLMQDVDQDRETIDYESFAWDKPILVVRSACMPMLASLLNLIKKHSTRPQVHIISHQSDLKAIKQIAPFPFTFHAYPSVGKVKPPYALSGIRPKLDSLKRELGRKFFGSLIYLEYDPASGSMEHIRNLLKYIDKDKIYRYANFRSPYLAAPRGAHLDRNEYVRRAAQHAFDRLIDWYSMYICPNPESVKQFLALRAAMIPSSPVKAAIRKRGRKAKRSK